MVRERDLAERVGYAFVTYQSADKRMGRNSCGRRPPAPNRVKTTHGTCEATIEHYERKRRSSLYIAAKQQHTQDNTVANIGPVSVSIQLPACINLPAAPLPMVNLPAAPLPITNSPAAPDTIIHLPSAPITTFHQSSVPPPIIRMPAAPPPSQANKQQFANFFPGISCVHLGNSSQMIYILTKLNKASIVALLDTGSALTIVSETVAGKIKAQLSRPKITKGITANGSIMNLLGQFSPRLTIGSKTITITCYVALDANPARRLANGNLVLSMRIADPSGSIIFTIMNAEVQDLFEPGDIIKIKNGFTNVHRGMLNLSCGRQGEFMKSGDFMLLYSETPNMSEFNSEYAAMERARKPSPPPEGEKTITEERWPNNDKKQKAGGAEDIVILILSKSSRGINKRMNAANPWEVSVAEYQANSVQFASLYPQNGRIDGNTARNVLMKSNLPPQILAQQRVGFLTGQAGRSALGMSGLPTTALAHIWTLSDVNKDGKLTVDEFCIAMHLIDMVKVSF
ncbi:EF hand [Teladorsagia circumcincta]|uniref:EF hand n=3 Tax=Teladorsagia circumcincta TaxID=45464 RepID=A0A2G9UF30_TELCI|nr:EF hand [Teladorsagia circumcincta]